MSRTIKKTKPDLTLTPATLKGIELLDNTAVAELEVGILLYRNLEVETHEVYIEGKPFKLVGSDDQLTEEQRPWFHLFTGKATIEVVGGLDVLVRVTGQRAPRPSLPQGRAWLVVKIGDSFLAPRLEPACGATGVGTSQFVYEI